MVLLQLGEGGILTCSRPEGLDESRRSPEACESFLSEFSGVLHSAVRIQARAEVVLKVDASMERVFVWLLCEPPSSLQA